MSPACPLGALRGVPYESSLRWITAGEVEVMRMIGVVVRDHRWRTPPPLLGSVDVRHRHGRAELRARVPLGRGAIDWRLEVEPAPDGFVATATLDARGEVRTNRAGLVVLLPCADYAGSRFRAIAPDGASTQGRLQRDIAAHCPASNIAAIRFARRDGIEVEIAFAGEVFEMEDQRNWLDPSYKLYGRLLARPFPYRLRDGQRVVQRATVRVRRARHSRRTNAARSGRPGRVPALGFAWSRTHAPRDEPVRARLAALAPDFVLAPRAGAAAVAARELADELGCPLRAEAIAPDRARVVDLARLRPEVVYLHRSDDAARVTLLATHDCAIGGGTYADFVMINRQGIDARAGRVSFALCPTVHGADDRTLVESLAALPDVLDAARRFAGSRPLDLGPCTLRRRLVPATGKPADRPFDRRGVPADVDARIAEPIAAAWFATLVAIAATRRAASVCAFEGAGARGLVAARESFPVEGTLADDRCRPVAAAFASLAQARGARLVLLGLDVGTGAAFTLDAPRPQLWLVNLAAVPRDLPAPPVGWRANLLGPRRGWRPAGRATRSPAYGVVRYDLDRPADARAARVAKAWIAPRGARG